MAKAKRNSRALSTQRVIFGSRDVAADNVFNVIVPILAELVELMKRGREADIATIKRLEHFELQIRAIADLTNRDAPLTMPSVPPEKWLLRNRSLSETPVSFIERVYGPWLRNDGGLTRANIRRLDPSLYLALYKHLSKGGVLPRSFILPTQAEANTRLLRKSGFLSGQLSDAQREVVRLYQIAQRRPRK